MHIGILASLTTCALWGLTFVAPRAVEPFSAWDLTVARYGVFGLACLLLMLHPRFRPAGLSSRRRAVALLLGGAGYVGYFVSAAFAVKLAGAAIPPLVIGTMPVFLAARPLGALARTCASPRPDSCWRGDREYRHNQIGQFDGSRLDLARHRIGVRRAFIWVVYGLVNAAVMRAPDAPDGLRWTGLQGIGAALGTLVVLPLSSLTTLDAAPAPVTYRFIVWALVMGLAGSWFATLCWVVASRRLPLLSRPNSLWAKRCSV